MAEKYTYATKEELFTDKSVSIGFNEVTPENVLNAVCNFELKPTTPSVYYDITYSKILNTDVFNKMLGSEIPLPTTSGDIVIKDSQGIEKYKKHISGLINTQGVSDTFSNEGIKKVWSDKFYLFKEPDVVTTVAKRYSWNRDNDLCEFYFTEEDFKDYGLPAKKTVIPVISPCFVMMDQTLVEPVVAGGTNNGDGDGNCIYGADAGRGYFYWDEDTSKYVLKIRIMKYDSAYFTLYSKVYFHYELEVTKINPSVNFAISLQSGDTCEFIQDLDINTYISSGILLSGQKSNTTITENLDVTPDININIPLSIKSAISSFDNTARMLNNMEINSQGNSNNYNWIGDGDGITDYTSKIQNKIDEFNILNGGIIYLGNGIYNINKSLIIYDNISIIGTGDTIINQTSDKTHGIIINGSNINIEDLTIKLSGNCNGTTEHVLSKDFDSEIIGCIYVNSSNIKTNADFDDRYSENLYCQHITIKDVTLLGTYGFKWEGNYQAYPDNKNTYKGCGIVGGKMFFNYLFADNIRMKKLYCGYYGTGGSNIVNLFCTDCKIMVYDLGGGYNNFDIKGHSSYGPTSDTETISISDMVVYSNGEDNNYNIQTYDSQWFKYLVYFDSFSMFNKYNAHYFSGGYEGNINEIKNNKGILKSFVYNVGRGNVCASPYVNDPFHIGTVRYNLSGQTEFKDVDTILYNVLAGAGIWGDISTTTNVDETRLSLANVCRYPNNDHIVGSYILFNEIPSVENPIEIIIDVTNRPIYAFPNIFIQFSHEYVASDFSITWYTDYDNELRTENVKDNTNVVYFYNLNQQGYYNVHKIKINITKALNIPQLIYRSSDYTQHIKNYNENNKVGIVNIGMVGDTFGRSFLGECGGTLYGDLNLDKNYIKLGMIEELPIPSEEYRGKQIILKDDINGDSIMVCLFDGTNYKWVNYSFDETNL